MLLTLLFTAMIREKVLANGFPSEIFRLPRGEYEARIKDIYKQVAQGCIELQDKVGNYASDRINTYAEKETEIRTILSKMPTAEKIIEMLSFVGHDMKEFYTFYSNKKINDAIIYAKDLKDRYTVLWINYDFFGEENNV